METIDPQKALAKLNDLHTELPQELERIGAFLARLHEGFIAVAEVLALVKEGGDSFNLAAQVGFQAQQEELAEARQRVSDAERDLKSVVGYLKSATSGRGVVGSPVFVALKMAELALARVRGQKPEENAVQGDSVPNSAHDDPYARSSIHGKNVNK